jgi:hypothetical protein
MAIYKSLGPDDISRIPFNANKQFSFHSGSSSSPLVETNTVGINFQTFEYPTSTLDTFSNGTDTNNSIKYQQLDHLFYKNHLRDISNRLGDADYLSQKRNLYVKANVISIPSNLFGNKIKPGTFTLSGSFGELIDDKKGNLIISGTNLSDHNIDERNKVFNLGPIKSFKQYNINYDFYGKTNPNPLTHYNETNIYDDSYYSNILEYKNIIFSPQDYDLTNVSGSKINFLSNGSLTSSIVAPHNETYNFNPEEDFTISFFINPVSASGYIASKSTTKTLIRTPINEKTFTTGSSQPFNVREKNNYPFEIFINDTQNLTFRKSDGTNTPTVTVPIATGSLHHVVCMSSASVMEIWMSGSKIASTSDTTTNQTENQANLYIGSKGEISNYYTGSLSNIMIFNSSKTTNQIKNLSSSLDGNPYAGNIFYSNGIATITHPKYQDTIAKPNNTELKLSFKNIHPIYENEYQCTVQADEYNFTHNISTRKIKSDQKPDLANFATGSQFKPYVTTVGLYNENNELLVVGKLGQPTRMSDETDTTFVLRWDT